MKLIIAVLAGVICFAAPVAAGDDKAKKQTEQSATKDEKKDSGIVEKAVKMKAIDAVGNDGIVEKGAKAKVLTK